MGLLNKIKNNQPTLPSPPNTSNEDLILDKEELKYLLSTISQSTFPGKDIEVLYNLTWKLQKAYLYLDKD